jgi:glycosyltransferase involved in cell wall biosynthesis
MARRDVPGGMARRATEGLAVAAIRVLHCIHSLCGGGAERQLGMLAAASHAHGMAAAIFCVDDTGSNVDRADVPIYKSARRNRYDMAIFGALDRAVDDFKPQVLHAWLPASITIPAMLVAARRSIPCVYSYRNAMSFHRPLTVPEYLIAMLTAARIIANNSMTASTLPYRWLFTLKKGVHIDNAVNIEPQWIKQPCTQRSGTWNVLFAGRLTGQKNWQCALRAMTLAAGRSGLRLTICGDGEQRSDMLATIRELGLDDCVAWEGYRHDIYRLMSGADMLVVPSWWEGMPNVLLESLAIGLPCAVSDIPAHRRIIGATRAALLFDPADPGALAHCIERLRGDPALVQRLAIEGRKLSEAYSADRMAQSHHDVYAGLACADAAVAI